MGSIWGKFLKVFLRYDWSMIAVTIRAYGLLVQVESTESYPDAAQDVANRALDVFADSVGVMKQANIPLYDPEVAESDVED